jgi:isocitrate dehydrogenase
MNGDGDFYGNEKSVIIDGAQTLTIELNGNVVKEVEAEDKEVIDGTFMSAAKLRDFYAQTIKEAAEKDLIWSLHLKATMMKISDPIMFGHAVEMFFKDVFEKYADEFEKLGVNPNLGLGDLYDKLKKSDKGEEIEAAIKDVILNGKPDIAMSDSDNLVTNLDAPNLIIIDASMPVVVREGGKQWDKTGAARETLAVIPDSTYAFFHEAMLEDVKKNGQFDVTTMGTMQNGIDVSNMRIYKDLGVAYALAGNLKKSEFFTKKAISVNPNDASLYYNLGVTYYRAAVAAEKNGYKDSAVYYIKLSQKYFAIQKNMTNKK